MARQKHLYILRHAKAEKGWPGLPDIDRPLHPIGVEETNRIARMFSSSTPPPELVICSPAVRTFSTALITCRVIGYEASSIRLDGRIYEARLSDLFRVLADVEDHVKSVLMVGHNPSVTDLVNTFSNNVNHMKTGSLFGFGFDCPSWSEIEFSDAVKVRAFEP
ncbi:MAG: hypothetical protein RL090_1831 [Bacteroidota bacterium]|jgi:phosphohistidine phosphatase